MFPALPPQPNSRGLTRNLMNDLNNSAPQEYLSTRESAKKLQVSLGTVQKMVEMGELVAWKTRGGHRRILLRSLEQFLNRRQAKIRQIGTRNCVLLAIFKREENKDCFLDLVKDWDLSVDLCTNTDTLEALMQAVEINPDIIYIDALISPVEQVHLIHYLSKNTKTSKIPILAEERFISLHPGVIGMAAENTGILKPGSRNEHLLINGGVNDIDHPLMYSYPALNDISDFNDTKAYTKDLENIVKEILANRFESSLNI